MPRSIQRVLCSLASIFLIFAMLLPGFASAGARAIKSKVTPVYPEIARRMNISGTVKLQVTIAPDGSVKTVKPLGGHPLLIDSAVNAVKSWKYESAKDETVELINIVFSPN